MQTRRRFLKDRVMAVFWRMWGVGEGCVAKEENSYSVYYSRRKGFIALSLFN